jgi:hypothetical protein
MAAVDTASWSLLERVSAHAELIMSRSDAIFRCHSHVTISPQTIAYGSAIRLQIGCLLGGKDVHVVYLIVRCVNYLDFFIPSAVHHSIVHVDLAWILALQP